MNVKKFIEDTLPHFDVGFDPNKETSYHQEMLHSDYATIIETLVESESPEAWTLPEAPWSGRDLKWAMERVLAMPEDALSGLTFELLAQHRT